MVLSDVMSGRENNFNLIRMLAASGVLVSHAWPISLGPDVLEPFKQSLGGISLGFVCVWVFFVISGFFIAQSFDRSATLGAFIRARILRLFPALLVVLMLTVLVAGVFLTTSSAREYWASVPAYVFKNATLFLPQYPLPGVFEDNPLGTAINGSLWTLRYEVLCYTGLTLVALTGALKRGRDASILLALTAVGLALTSLFEVHQGLYYLFQLGFPFVLGMTFYAWRDRLPCSPVVAIALALISVLVAQFPLPDFAFRLAFVTALGYAVFLIGFAPAVRFDAYNRLGDYSYGMYIYAFPIQQLVAYHGVAQPHVNIVLAFVLTLVCAVLSWVLIEKPALALKNAPLLWRRARP